MNKTQIISILSIASVSITLCIIFIVILIVKTYKLKNTDTTEYNIQIEDLFASKTAEANGINNTTTDESILLNMKNLIVQVLEPLYKAIPFTINSGFRTSELNKLVGSTSKNSQHLTGEAADITTGTTDGNKQLFEYIKNNLPYDQLINEKNYSWVHVSLKRIGYNRKQNFNL